MEDVMEHFYFCLAINVIVYYIFTVKLISLVVLILILENGMILIGFEDIVFV